MDKNEWYKVGEEISDQVQSAIDTGNYPQLGKMIGDSVNRAVSDVSNTISDAFGGNSQRTTAYRNTTSRSYGTNQGKSPVENGQGSYGQKQGWYGQNPYGQNMPAQNPLYRKPNIRPDSRYFDRSPKGSVAGILYMVFGYTTTGISAAAAAIIAILLALGVEAGAAFGELGIVGAMLAVGIGMGSYGSVLRGRVKRYRQYVDLVKEHLYCSIADMASRTGRSEKYIRKDLKKMMQLGMFRQAHLDSKETCLIASDEMYEQYKAAQQSYEEEQRRAEEERRAQTEKAQSQTAPGEEVRKVIEEGQNYVRLIRKCNDDIPGEEMSDKLDRLELLVTRIFGQVEKEPDLAPELRKMLSYYLPTTQKLLEAYRDLDQQQIEVNNIAQTKKEIESAVDTINEAFEKFLNELFRDKAWDIQSDISVLNTMLKQDGYLKKDFDHE